MAEIKTIAAGLTFTEGPRWHEGRWWFSDFYTHGIYSMTATGSELRKELDVPTQPSGLGWLPDGRLLFVSMTGRRVMRREADGSVAVHADLSSLATGPLNDMVVDAQGRAYVGNFGFDLMSGAPFSTANLVLVRPDGSAQVVAHDLYFPNGSVIAAGRLIVGESFGNRTSVFDIKEDGTLGPRVDWAVYAPLPTAQSVAEMHEKEQIKFVADGCGLDAEGCLWVADAGHRRVVRVKEGGEILQSIDPGTNAYACMLGGEDGRDLLMCCAPDFAAEKRRAATEADLRVARVQVPHAGLP